jgi:uncharacterized protein YyaL (SSP411 family)
LILYEATLEPKHLDFAIALAEAMIAKFYDAENGGFWQSAAGAKDLILRVKDDYDGAEPSGNSVATLALLKLAAITGREGFQKPAAEATLRLFAHRLQNFPQAMPFMLHALDFRWKNRAASSLPAIQIQNNFANCCTPRIRFISRTKLFWAMWARLRNLRAACRQKMKRWFISAPANRASRRPATRRR